MFASVKLLVAQELSDGVVIETHVGEGRERERLQVPPTKGSM